MTEKQNTLWLIDDDPALRLILEDAFVDAGLDVVVFANAKGAWARLNDVLGGHEDQAVLPDVILTDIRMPMMDGLSFSDWVHRHFAQLPIVIMTAHSDLKSAVDSYQTGAFEYLPKPFDLDDAIGVIRKAMRGANVHKGRADDAVVSGSDDALDDLEGGSTGADSVLDTANDMDRVSSDVGLGDGSHDVGSRSVSSTSQGAGAKGSKLASTRASTKPVSKPAGKPTTKSQGKKSAQKTHIIGQSVAMQTVFRAIGRLSASPITVLITGESGTGKELVAGALHEHSPRADKPFIALNMAAIPHDLIESELFGHEKGAFTGATAARQGRFEQANGGTLFLDEIGDMPFSTQTRLLRVLANGEFFRVGGQKPIKVDVRIIAATHQNLEQLVREGKFREDLFYRLNVIRLPLPPLRERPEDIPALVDFFMARASDEMNSDEKQLSESAIAVMQAFDWSGNVRQLENACRWITVMATGDEVLVEDLPPELTEFAGRLANGLAEGSGEFLQGGADSLSELSDVNQIEQGYEDSYENDFVNEHVARSHELRGGLPASDGVNRFGSLPVMPAMSSQQSQRLPSLPSPPISGSTNTPTSSSWQQKLQLWANQALNQGQTDILQLATPEFERVLIEVALKHTRGRKGEAAELLGWGRNTLTRKLKQFEDDE